jgi:NitT/TauT family transport system substrate-binding protein
MKSLNRVFGKILGLISVAALILVVPLMAPAEAQDKVTVRTDWFHGSYHSPFFLGIEKGFYSDVGIDLTPTEGRGSGQVVQLVGVGDDQFGFASVDAVFRGVAKEIPVISVANIMPTMGQAVFVLNKSGITSADQLRGKSFAMTPGGTNEALLPAFLADLGMTMDDITPITVSPANKVRMFLGGQFDAMMATAWAAGIFESAGGSVKFVYSDHGVKMVGYNIITNTKLAEENPDLVQRFIQATLRSWKYSKEHPEEALDALAKHSATNAKPDRRKRNSGDLAEAMAFVGVAVKGQPMGVQSRQDWIDTQTMLLKFGVLDKALPVDSYFTNAYVLSPMN